MRDTYFIVPAGRENSYMVCRNEEEVLFQLLLSTQGDKVVRVGAMDFTNRQEEGCPVHLVNDKGDLYVRADGEYVYTPTGIYAVNGEVVAGVRVGDSTDLHMYVQDVSTVRVQMEVEDGAINPAEALRIVTAILVFNEWEGVV